MWIKIETEFVRDLKFSIQSYITQQSILRYVSKRNKTAGPYTTWCMHAHGTIGVGQPNKTNPDNHQPMNGNCVNYLHSVECLKTSELPGDVARERRTEDWGKMPGADKASQMGTRGYCGLRGAVWTVARGRGFPF